MSNSKPERPATESTGPQISRDLVAGIVTLGVVAVFLGNAGEVSRGEYDWLFPVALSYALGVFAVILMLRGLLGRGERMPVVPVVLRGQGIDVLVFCVLTVLYVVLVPRLGFWATSTTMIVAGAVVLDTRRSVKTVLLAVAVAVAVTVVGYLTLTDIFYVRFPTGPWGW
jgi:hypothetical protein